MPKASNTNIKREGQKVKIWRWKLKSKNWKKGASAAKSQKLKSIFSNIETENQELQIIFWNLDAKYQKVTTKSRKTETENQKLKFKNQK